MTVSAGEDSSVDVTTGPVHHLALGLCLGEHQAVQAESRFLFGDVNVLAIAQELPGK